MTKLKTIHTCQSCGYISPKWLGRCPDCLSWNTLLEEKVSEKDRTASKSINMPYSKPQPINKIERIKEDRVLTAIGELDRVLGGGVVMGSAVLVGGDPGIGKSTLLLQALNSVAEGGRQVLYVSGEESPIQIKLRADRLGVASENLCVLAENSLERIIEVIENLKPKTVVIDSIQTISTSELSSTAGTIAQLREVSAQLIGYAKTHNMPVFLIGHVTKDGLIAGPKVLEHMVDTVLHFEGDRGYPYRILRAIKNRFGSVNEIGVFEMRDGGLEEINEPSGFFIADRPSDAAGSVVVASIEGSRPILIEVESLVTPTLFGMPSRTIVGVDHKKVSLLIAVMVRKGGLKIGAHDIFLKIGGGLRVSEPAVDLGVVASVASNFLNKPVKSGTVVFGEVGLAGEIRGVHHTELRVKESAKMGFKRCIIPKDNLERLRKSGFFNRMKDENIEFIGVNNIEDFLGSGLHS